MIEVSIHSADTHSSCLPWQLKIIRINLSRWILLVPVHIQTRFTNFNELFASICPERLKLGPRPHNSKASE